MRVGTFSDHQTCYRRDDRKDDTCLGFDQNAENVQFKVKILTKESNFNWNEAIRAALTGVIEANVGQAPVTTTAIQSICDKILLNTDVKAHFDAWKLVDYG